MALATPNTEQEADQAHDPYSTGGEGSDDLDDIRQGEAESGFYNPDDEETANRLRDEAKRFSARQKPKDSPIKSLLKKKALLILIPAGLVAILVIVLVAVLGVSQFVHFAALIGKFHYTADQTLMGHRGGLLIRFAHTANNPIERNMGYFGNQFTDVYENKLKAAGIEPIYENRRIKVLAISPDTPEGKKALRDLRSRGIDVDAIGKDNKGRVRIDLDRGGTGDSRYRRHVLGGMTNSLGINTLNSAIAKRVLNKRAGVSFHPFKNTVRAGDENLRQYYDKRKKERAERLRNGVDSTVRKGTAGTTTDADGNPVPDPDAQQATQAANDIADQATNTSEPVETRSSKIKANLTKGVGATGYVATICAIKGLSDQAHIIRQTNLVMPLIRTGTEVSSMGSQIQAGQDLNMDEVGAMSEYLYDEKTETSWTDARSLQAELGQKQTGPDMPDGAKPGKDKPGFFKTLDTVIGAVPGGNTFCSGVNSKIGGWTLTVVGVGINAAGPISAAFAAGSQAAQALLVTEFMDDVIRWTAGEVLDTEAKGALYGNYANYGARLAANESSLSHGGSELTPTEEFALDTELRYMDRLQHQNSSLYARYLDPQNVNSLLAKSLFEGPAASTDLSNFASILRLPSAFFSSLISPVTSLVPKTSAANTYDYGFPEYGFTLDEMDDADFQDPYANAKIVEPKLAELNEKYGKPCFGTTVDPATFALNAGLSGGKPYKDIPAECKDRSNVELTRYRFYLADKATANAMACYELDDEAACSELGFAASTQSTETESTDGEGAAVTGTSKELAQKLLDSNNVTLQPNPRLSVSAAAKGEKSPGGVDKCGKQQPPVALDPKLLGFLVDLSQEDDYTITSLTTGAHSCTSNHYKGAAADFGCDIDIAKADRIGKKYGISHNNESCSDAIPHWHYSIGGN